MVTLPYLKVFHLYDSEVDPSWIFDHLTMPSLHTLDCIGWVGWVGHHKRASTQCLIDLLARSECRLTTLIFDAGEIKACDIRWSLGSPQLAWFERFKLHSVVGDATVLDWMSSTTGPANYEAHGPASLFPALKLLSLKGQRLTYMFCLVDNPRRLCILSLHG